MTNDNATPKDLAKVVFERLKGAKTNVKPSISVLVSLFETIFYTSLKTEESQFIKVTITLINSENPDPKPPRRVVANRWSYVKFKDKISFNTKNLVKLSKAADPWSSSLAVDFDSKGNLFIWGMIDQAIHYQSFLNYETESGPEQPGAFQTTITGIGSLVVLFDYELMAILKQNTLITNFIDVLNFGPVGKYFKNIATPHINQIQSFFGEYIDDDYFPWDDYIKSTIIESFSRILLSVQNYKHGGAVLITDVNSDLNIKHNLSYGRFSESINNLMGLSIQHYYQLQEIRERINKGNKTLPMHLFFDNDLSNFDEKEIRDELKGAIRFISSLTCIDGLVVLDSNLVVKGFGAVIKFKELPEYIYLSQSPAIYLKQFTKVNPDHFSTRHRSMFSYCWHNPESLGFVISQDGDIRAMMRVNDKLIMWENIKVQQYLKSDKLRRLLKKNKAIK